MSESENTAVEEPKSKPTKKKAAKKVAKAKVSKPKPAAKPVAAVPVAKEAEAEAIPKKRIKRRFKVRAKSVEIMQSTTPPSFGGPLGVAKALIEIGQPFSYDGAIFHIKPSMNGHAASVPVVGNEPMKLAAKVKSSGKRTRAKKGELRAAQIRILQALAKHGELNRKDLIAKSKATPAIGYDVGSVDPAKRAESDKKYPSLITLGYVETIPDENSGREGVSYNISAKGKEALTALAG